jgi:hypothetical protein
LDIPLKEEEMTINTNTRFDAQSYARAFDAWDIATLLEHYADDVELTMVTPDNPPGRPLVFNGKEPLRMMWQHAVSASARVSVRTSIVGDDGAAFTFDCEFPGDHVVVSNVLVELADGLIARQHEVMVGAPVDAVAAADESN